MGKGARHIGRLDQGRSARGLRGRSTNVGAHGIRSTLWAVTDAWVDATDARSVGLLSQLGWLGCLIGWLV
jgi:hypothetical protein